MNTEIDNRLDSLLNGNDEQGFSIEQEFDLLGQEIMANALVLMYKARSNEPISKEENDKQKEMIKRFEEIDKVLKKLKNQNRLSSGGGTKFDKDTLNLIKAKRSVISSIVVNGKKE